MHSAFNQFAAFRQDAIDNKAFVEKGKLSMPVLAIGADKSFGTAQANAIRFVATGCDRDCHFQFRALADEEQPAATIEAVSAFLKGPA